LGAGGSHCTGLCGLVILPLQWAYSFCYSLAHVGGVFYLMNTFLVTAHDAPDAMDRRLANRADHLARIAQAQACGTVLLAGALLGGPEGTTMEGSFLVVCLPTPQAVEAWLQQDCYVVNHVWHTWTIQPCGIPPCFTQPAVNPA
jgi:uncharacterized protein